MTAAPPGWRPTTLGRICAEGGGELQTGPFGSQLHAHDYVEDGVPLVMPRDLVAGRINISKVARVGEADAERLSQHRLRAGDVIFSRRGDVGRFAIVRAEEAGWLCGTGCLRARLGAAPVEPRYLHWCLLRPSTVAWFQDNAQGATMPNLNTSILGRTPLILPPLPEQRRIAAILDEADALRRKRREALALLDTLLQAAFTATVGDGNAGYPGWPHRSIESLAAENGMRTGPFGSALLHSEFAECGIAVLGIDNAVRNRFAWAERRFITPEKYEGLRRYTVRPNDVIITIMGTTGRSAVVPQNVPLAITTKHLATITPNTEVVLPEYLSNVLHRDPSVLRQIASENRGAIMDGLNLGIIRGLHVRLPPIPAQNRFVKALEEIRSLQGAHIAAADETSALLSSLLHRAFSGEL